MNWFLLTFSIVMETIANGILRNEYSKKEIKNAADLYLCNSVASLGAAVTLAIVALIMGANLVPSLYTVLMAILFGLVTAGATLFSMKALSTGPLSYTNVICCCSMIIPSLSGLVMFGEPVTAMQWVGCGLMLVSMICSVDSKNKGSGMSFKWLVFCLCSFCMSGSIGIMQKVHQNSVYKDEISSFLVIAFLVSSLFSLLVSLWYQKKKGMALHVLHNGRKFGFFGVVSGLGIAACNQINMYLAGVMPAIIFYPIVNSGFMFLCCLAGFFIWKEKLSKKQWFGLVAGAVAIFLLCGVI